MLKKITILIIFVIIGGTVQPQTDESRTLHFLSGTVNLGVDAGTTLGLTDYDELVPDFMVKVSGQFNLESYTNGVLGFRGFIQSGTVAGRDPGRDVDEIRCGFLSIGAGAVYTFQLGYDFFPYTFVGLSTTTIDPQDKYNQDLPYNSEGDFSKTQFNYHFEAGTRYRLNNEFAVNVNAGLQVSYSDNWDVLVIGGDDMMLQFLVGVTYTLFTKQDSDGDGVGDENDKCPNTPLGTPVDQFGCPSDIDNDGVADFEDECPNTPAGVAVDEYGCPKDTDADGVPDYLDKCPYTKIGIPVNNSGCPDSDSDGVGDDMDKCPNTPPDVQVDMFGCPRDTDKDGVPDYLDRCPNTPKGVPVDKTGCERAEDLIKRELEQEIYEFSTDECFLPTQDNFTIAGESRFERLAIILDEHPDTDWVIEAYTDNVGADSFNKELSQKQADLVKEFFIKMGIDEDRLTAVGYGKENPIASNDDIDGRAKNRRIIVRLDKE